MGNPCSFVIVSPGPMPLPSETLLTNLTKIALRDINESVRTQGAQATCFVTFLP
jgi:hypothetical protein